ncbi:hypothetical protein N3K66_007121 [Trichothecium roseum]|uniref:Uncharacterized protein n=1 Tax=Trichothecium roseum TaxID=47278 RepID=A0ACC0UX99_9HYPO|nr:hypothetical protein N3K66_007121 [Trichothecium roseum]
MFARSSARCAMRARIASPIPRHSFISQAGRFQRRRYSGGSAGGSSSSSAAASGSAKMSSIGALAPFASELDKIAPSFDIKGEQIRIIKTPEDFYETLKNRIRNAKRRIFLSTLYIGKSERELLDTLRAALRANPDLTLHILTDCLRGTREAPDPSCASLLAPLVEEFGGGRVEVRMYHTPNLTGLRKRHVPRRINEGWGLQHMKLYGVDDEVIMSGANLSADYFTDRQDRYHMFSSAEVTEHFWRIHRAVGEFSFLVTASTDRAGFELSWPETNSAPSPLEDPAAFVKSTTSTLRPLICPPPAAAATTKPVAPEFSDTRVYLLGQMSQVMTPDASTELPAMTHILRTLSTPSYKGSSWTFTAGYFNPDPALTNLLLSTASTSTSPDHNDGGSGTGSGRKVNTVITAAPEANGFYKSPGVSGMLPEAYTLLARRFLDAVRSADRAADISLREWRRGTVGQPGGWSYHAKGLWVTLPGEAHPSLSIVGSSNYTKRSYSLDLETGALVLTRDEGLKKRLGEEQAWLMDDAREVGRDDFAANERRVGLKVRIAMWIVSIVGGAL